MPGVFLTAEWRDLVVLNYEVDPQVLEPRVPAGCELDLWNGRAYVSAVGFMFLNTRLLGLPVPFHRNFEEINLRFYVRRQGPAEMRRGVTFIKELVPRWAIAKVARLIYNENYFSVPMSHSFGASAGERTLRYSWSETGRENSISARIAGPARQMEPGSLEEFILEHYWGYTRLRSGKTAEYRVEHPPWLVYSPVEGRLDSNAGLIYGSEFAEKLAGKPDSMVVAEGSAIKVYRGETIHGRRS